jgi:AcrR family transcriptional regulator
MSQPARSGGRQQQRSDDTRRALLDAAVESLVELGFAKTTTLEVQRRAGVSRGALLHHFPSKAELIAAAVVHLAEMRGRELKDKASRLPEGGDRVDAVLDLLWESFSGPLFYVAMDLRAAARTDDEFREVLTDVERDIRDRILHQSRRLFGPGIADRPNFDGALDMSLQFMIGASMTAILHKEQVRVAALIEAWKRVFPTLLDAPDAGLGTTTTSEGES